MTQVFFLQMHLACPLKHRLHMTTLDKKNIQNTKQQNQTTYFFQMQECSLDPLWRGLNLYSTGLGPQTSQCLTRATHILAKLPKALLSSHLSSEACGIVEVDSWPEIEAS